MAILDAAGQDATDAAGQNATDVSPGEEPRRWTQGEEPRGGTQEDFGNILVTLW